MSGKLTVKEIGARKGSPQKITMLTAYDAAMASLLEGAGIEIILVGDSLGMVALGYDNTAQVTLAEMLHHTAAVRRGAKNTFLIADMPYGSYHAGLDQAVENGIRFLKETGCDALKIEGGEEICDVVRGLRRAGIPVMGHIGLTPQTAGNLGGFKVQGQELATARKQLQDAQALSDAGVFGIVMECLPTGLAQQISQTVPIITIGIGAGPHCDGQVLVTSDLLGLYEKFTPRFSKQYLQLSQQIKGAVDQYCQEVAHQTFPTDRHSFSDRIDFSALTPAETS